MVVAWWLHGPAWVCTHPPWGGKQRAHSSAIHPPPVPLAAVCKAEPRCAKYTFFAYPSGDLPADGLYATCTDPTLGFVAPKCLLWAGALGFDWGVQLPKRLAAHARAAWLHPG